MWSKRENLSEGVLVNFELYLLSDWTQSIKEELDTIHLKLNRFHGEWNYKIMPCE